jgi:hypothetical protein
LLAAPKTIYAAPYQRLSGIDLSSYEDKIFIVNNFHVSYKYRSLFYNENRYLYLNNIIVDITKLVFEYVDSSNINISMCDHSHNIIIYEISIDYLNNNDIFPKEIYRKDSDIIYGFWEPVGVDDIIVVSSQKLDIIFLEVLSHEIAHYWYNRLRIADNSGVTHEEFALKIEELSMRKMGHINYE